MLRLICGFLVLLTSPLAQARVFSFKTSWVAAYIRGAGGMTAMNNEAYNGTSGNNTAFGDGPQYTFAGELGFAFLLSDTTAVRIGLEGVESKPISTTGTAYSNGATLMDVSSLVTVFNPNLTFEFAFENTGVSKLYMFLGGGYAIAKVNNSYSNVNTGAYGSAASYSETWQGNAISGTAGVGFEYHTFDNVTFALEGGYRYMKFATLTQDGSDTVIRGTTTTTVSSGQTVVDGYGNDVHIDMSGLFVGVMVRFFIPPLN